MGPEEFMRLYERATNAHDLELLMSLIDDEAIYLFSDESAHIGRAAVKSVLERNFSIIADETYAISHITWLLKTDEAAACTYDYAWSGLIRGQPAAGFGRGTTILKAEGEAWKVVHEHLSKGRLSA